MLRYIDIKSLLDINKDDPILLNKMISEYSMDSVLICITLLLGQLTNIRAAIIKRNISIYCDTNVISNKPLKIPIPLPIF